MTSTNFLQLLCNIFFLVFFLFYSVKKEIERWREREREREQISVRNAVWGTLSKHSIQHAIHYGRIVEGKPNRMNNLNYNPFHLVLQEICSNGLNQLVIWNCNNFTTFTTQRNASTHQKHRLHRCGFNVRWTGASLSY